MNSYNVNPVVVDTPMQGSYKSNTALSLGVGQVLLIRKVLWTGPKNQGDQVLIVDPASGHAILRLVAQGQDIPQNVDFIPPRLTSDFSVVQIDSGEIELHLA